MGKGRKGEEPNPQGFAECKFCLFWLKVCHLAITTDSFQAGVEPFRARTQPPAPLSQLRGSKTATEVAKLCSSQAWQPLNPPVCPEVPARVCQTLCANHGISWTRHRDPARHHQVRQDERSCRTPRGAAPLPLSRKEKEAVEARARACP